jgi:hypothetical protein
VTGKRKESPSPGSRTSPSPFHDLSLSRHCLPGGALSPNRLQLARLDMAKDPPPKPPQHPAYGCQLAGSGPMVWSRLLPLYGLALASKGSPRANRPPEQLPHLSLRRLDGDQDHGRLRSKTRLVLPSSRPRRLGHLEPQGFHHR